MNISILEIPKTKAMHLLETDVKTYELRSAEGLRYTLSDDMISIANRFGDIIAELTFNFVKDGIFHDRWYGYLHASEYREIMSGPVLDYFIKFRCTKKICDTNKLIVGMDSETSLWFKDIFLPQMISAGLEYNAFIMPKENYARLSMQFFEQNLENKYCMVFPSFDMARCWMELLQK